MKQFTQIFNIVIITILMGVYLSSILEIEQQEKELLNTQHLIDSLTHVNDSLSLKIDTLNVNPKYGTLVYKRKLNSY